MLALLLGTGLSGLGLYGWQTPPPLERPFAVEEAVPMPTSGMFGRSLTVHATLKEDEDPPAPAAYACTLTGPDGTVQLDQAPDHDTAGTRVKEGRQYLPVVVVGKTRQGQTLTCHSAPGATAKELWLLPTDLSPSRAPLALIVAGLLAFGGAALVHPRTRSI